MITNQMRIIICLVLSFLLPDLHVDAQKKSAAAGFGHAHNDYEKRGRKDFQDAINNACHSIEIDVFPDHGKLKVAHIPLFLGFRKSFEERYLKKLAQVYKNEDHIFAVDSIRLILMIDVKRNAAEAYQLLKNLAIKYKDLLAVWDQEGKLIKDGPIELLISGAKPYKELLADSIRYMRIDGDFGKIGDSTYSKLIVPRVSNRYGSFLKWRGKGEMPKEEEDKLRLLIQKAHADGREVRFWAMPNKLKVWQKMREIGVDWLNVDAIKKFKKFVDAGLLK
jgi:hypothetical protein